MRPSFRKIEFTRVARVWLEFLTVLPFDLTAPMAR
jgi:hypothetical protein